MDEVVFWLVVLPAVMFAAILLLATGFWNALVRLIARIWIELTLTRHIRPLLNKMERPRDIMLFSPYGRKRDYGSIPFYPYRTGYQPLAPIEHGPPPRSASAIIPVRSIFQQMDDMIDMCIMRSSGDMSDSYFALSSEHYHDFYHKSILQWRYVGDWGNLHYHTIPVIEQDDVPGGIALKRRGGQSNTALLALMKSIEAGIAQHQRVSLSYSASIEDEPVIRDGQSADNGKVRAHTDEWEQLLVMEWG